MLDFRVDTFLAVCKHMNFTKAAEELNITQPGVSKHIHQLEESYGVKLFGYEGKKLFLTEAGRVFQAAAATLKHDDLYLRDRLSSLREQNRLLNFGATLTVGNYLMPRAIACYLERHPDARVNMGVANTQALLKQIDAGRIDFAIVEGFFEKNDYDHLTFSTERYLAVCTPDYAFQKPVRVLEDLLEERLITRELGSGTRDILERNLELKNLTVRDFARRLEIGSIDAVKGLVLAGCGVAFLYEAAVRQELRAGTLREIPLEDLNDLHEFTFLWRKNSLFPEDYHALFSELKEFMQPG